MATTSSTPNSTLEEKEKRFRQKIQILESIESEINSLNKNYSDGQLQMGLASFQNDNLHHHLQPKAFSVGPATLLANYDSNKKQFSLAEVPKEQIKFIYNEDVAKDKQDSKNKVKISYLVDNDEEDEEYIKEEQQRLEKQYKEKGNNPISQLGIQYPPNALLNAQASMKKTLESALKIANLLQSLK